MRSRYQDQGADSYLDPATFILGFELARSGDIAKALGFKPVGQIGAPTDLLHMLNGILGPTLW
jgi:hypothetical protein